MGIVLAFSLAVSCGLAAGCGANDTTAPTTFHELQIRLSQAQCEAATRCCGTVCSPYSDASFNRTFVDAQQRIDAGKARYDAEAGARCLHLYLSQLADCDAQSNGAVYPDICDSVLAGVGARDSSCRSTVDCGPSLYCAFASTCRPYARQDESCVGDNCIPGTSCDAATQTCRPPAGKGQPCGQVPCDQSTQVLVCGPQLKCLAPLAPGTPCELDEDCTSQRCSGTPKTCEPLAYAQTLRGTLCQP